MASNIPSIRQYTWESLPPQLLMSAIYSVIAHFLKLDDYLGFHGIFSNIMYGAFGQLIIWFIIRNIYAKHHAQGMELVRQEKYADAIPFFIDSYQTFSKHSWVDKYRYYLGSSSKISYKEMDLNNIAFCYGQIGDKEKSIEYYRQTLSEFPDSGIAKTALTLINTMTDNKQIDDKLQHDELLDNKSTNR